MFRHKKESSQKKRKTSLPLKYFTEYYKSTLDVKGKFISIRVWLMLELNGQKKILEKCTFLAQISLVSMIFDVLQPKETIFLQRGFLSSRIKR